MKVVWNTCDKERGGEMKSAYEISKRSLKAFKSHILLEKPLEKNSI